jgi:hypothetical protein
LQINQIIQQLWLSGCNLTDIPNLRWRLIADYILEHHTEGVSLYGTSFGGFEILRGLKVFKNLQSEGADIPLRKIGLIVTPASGQCIQINLRNLAFLGIAQAEAGLAKITNNVSSRLMGKFESQIDTRMVKVSVSELRAIMIKLRTLAFTSQLKTGELPDNLEVHYFGTDKDGTLDPLVNQPKSLEELRKVGTHVEEHWFDPDPTFSHMPTEEHTKKLLQDIIQIFS